MSTGKCVPQSHNYHVGDFTHMSIVAHSSSDCQEVLGCISVFFIFPLEYHLMITFQSEMLVFLDLSALLL